MAQRRSLPSPKKGCPSLTKELGEPPFQSEVICFVFVLFLLFFSPEESCLMAGIFSEEAG